MVRQFFESLSPDQLKNLFYLGNIAIGVVFFLVILWLRGRPQESGFKPREDSAPNASKKRNGPDRLAEARIVRNEPLRLGGISVSGPPHETLGVAPNADAAQIQQAYRALMKRYHPDQVGRPGTREWKDAQRIAEAINLAKEEMMKRARNR
jgi:hypothetical protein